MLSKLLLFRGYALNRFDNFATLHFQLLGFFGKDDITHFYKLEDSFGVLQYIFVFEKQQEQKKDALLSLSLVTLP